MLYIVTIDTVGLAIGSMSETANDVDEALNKARQMYEDGWQTFQLKTNPGTKSMATSWWIVLWEKRRSQKTYGQFRKLA